MLVSFLIGAAVASAVSNSQKESPYRCRSCGNRSCYTQNASHGRVKLTCANCGRYWFK